MSNSADTWSETMSLYAAREEAATFGHLAPEPRRTYAGYIVFCHSVYGDIVAIDVDFKDLPASPWFYSDQNDFIATVCESRRGQEGAVYRFDGTYTKFKNGGYRFSGKTTRVYPGSKRGGYAA